MAFICNKKILRFKFSINNSFCVKDLKANNNFCDKHPNGILIEDELFAFEIEVNITTRKVFHDYVDLVLILESLPNCHE